jgi:C-terminal processing protease CtpA/Prc
MTLPGGIFVRFTGQAVSHADGRPLQRVGLIPDVEAAPTVNGLRAGRDEVLEAALQDLEVRARAN